MTENSKEENKAFSNLNHQLLEEMNDRWTKASYSMSPLSKINNLELISQFKLVKHLDSNRVNDLLIN